MHLLHCVSVCGLSVFAESHGYSFLPAHVRCVLVSVCVCVQCVLLNDNHMSFSCVKEEIMRVCMHLEELLQTVLFLSL